MRSSPERESLGQVASQTLQAIACTDAAASMPVFRPLIGMDKSEIVKIARDIDTFDILDAESLIRECVENISITRIAP